MADDSELNRARRLLKTVKAERETPNPWVEAHELAGEPQPEREWVIPDLVERQHRLLIAGAEGCGKSLMALTLAVQAAAGMPVLDVFPMEKDRPVRVLYLDLEMARSSTRRRLRTLQHIAGKNLERGNLQFFLRPDGLDLSRTRDSQELTTRLSHLEPDLVVLDPFYKMTITDSLYEREIKPTLKVIDNWRLAYGCAVIIIHHLRKRPQGEVARGRDNSDLFGSSVLLRWPELIAIQDEQQIRFTKDRDENLGEMKRWPIVRGPQWPIGLNMPQFGIAEDVYDYILNFGPASGNQIYRELGKRRQDVLECLRVLESQGRIKRRGDKWETD